MGSEGQKLNRAELEKCLPQLKHCSGTPGILELLFGINESTQELRLFQR